MAQAGVAGRSASGVNAASAAAPAWLHGWLDAILQVASHYRVPCSRESIRTAAAWEQSRDVELAVRQMARQAGLAVRWLKPELAQVTTWHLPLVVVLEDGQVAVITAMTREQDYEVRFSGDQGLAVVLEAEALQRQVRQLAVLRPAQSVPDSRVDEYIKPYEPHWLRAIVWRDLRPYAHIMLASLVANVLALAGILFSMQVYDRVVPAQSFPTLYVLFGGVMLAMAFAFFMRQARVAVSDILGKRADMRVSDKVFGHALRVRNSARPKATGTFISQLRELEHIREFMTSTTIAAVADLPFFALFCVLFWYIAGPLVWVPLAAVVLMVVPGLLVQGRLHRLAQEGMREGALRNAMLVESVQGMEDIKVLQAEPRFQNQWNHYNAVSAESGLKLRGLVGTLNNWTQTVQGAVFVVVVCVGAPMVMEGTMTTGVLVAASILSSRMLAPLASVTALISRWQQSRVAAEGVGKILQLPVDNPEQRMLIHRPLIQGEYDIRNAVFSYDGKTPVLQVASLQIRPGERVAVLGKNGAGKSTLLQALSGLMEHGSGTVLLDGVNMAHIDPADVRRDVGLVSQNARLFHGTLRENLLLGTPHASDEEVIAVLQSTGAWGWVQKMEQGLDYLVQEGGLGLSGGQRQSLLLARTLLRNPCVLLLDEPTASLDEVAESQVIQSLAALGKGRTLVIATHRMSILSLVDRVLVLDNGRIIMNDSRDKVLERLRGHARASEAPAAAAASAATGVKVAVKARPAGEGESL